ncbi:MAG: CDP-alcohol phosphatidyltransferase family protein [Proteobacteria bacterium]|nr:CDP-alcohol phosphatidyltransferase family protein [Pseudomonadota bacterium]MBS0574169.1 CDP-alcohol phosphatidyltransferase family protein [Pseudomonadota bacterium]
MIDRFLQPPMRAALALPARLLARLGLGPDQATLAGLGVAVLCFGALCMGWYSLALGLLALNRLLDGLDGALARAGTPTGRGAFLDIVADFLFYALVPLGFALADPAANALAAAVLLAAFIGTGATFLAFAAVAAGRGLAAAAFPAKGIYYLGGLTEGAETIAVFTAMCLWPDRFAPLAWLFSGLCLVTVLTRLHMGWTILGGPDGGEPE